MAGITIEHKTENRFDDKMWWVMDDGICFTRCDTEEEAEQVGVELAQADRQTEFVSAQMDLVQESIMQRFGLSPEDACRAMQEWSS